MEQRLVTGVSLIIRPSVDTLRTNMAIILDFNTFTLSLFSFKVTDCKPMKGNEKVENNEDLRQQLGTERREDEPCHH